MDAITITIAEDINNIDNTKSINVADEAQLTVAVDALIGAYGAVTNTGKYDDKTFLHMNGVTAMVPMPYAEMREAYKNGREANRDATPEPTPMAEVPLWQRMMIESSKIRDERRQVVGAPFSDAHDITLADGYYTVQLGTDGHVTFRVREWKGKDQQAISYLNGPNNEGDYVGFASIDRRGHCFVWSRFNKPNLLVRQKNALRVLIGAPGTDEFTKAYAMDSGRCAICNRLLTNPESIEFGIGPECRKKVA